MYKRTLWLYCGSDNTNPCDLIMKKYCAKYYHIVSYKTIFRGGGGGGAHWNLSLWSIITWCIRCNRHGEHLQAFFTWYNVVMKCIRGQCRPFGNIHVSRLPATAHWGRHFTDILKCIFFNENVWISINISLKSVPKGPSNNISALVQIIAWHRSGDKTLFEAMMAYFSDAYMRYSASLGLVKLIITHAPVHINDFRGVRARYVKRTG